ncbi:rho-associated protein kinase 2 isoform X2 [Drosophila innubila]|uniref:rho-associated protein kinase 2 isoform X2 n=1 Tax=Drosophila innubila TaxID=198719 RepID=UPI00148B56B8|nr:rho-associated protein kinase 2 isoform X2 [Drosophila innubila]
MGDDLDIYNDLDDFQESEEQKSKVLQAWETKFADAQVEINNYLALIKALEKKIKTMEVNFQNLLDTAKAEIKRKDTLITQLRKEKDDICFRRKRPNNFAQVSNPSVSNPSVSNSSVSNPSVTNPFKQTQRQEPKRFKLEETVGASDVVYSSNKWDKELQDDKKKTQETVQEKKTDHKRGEQFNSEAKSSQRNKEIKDNKQKSQNIVYEKKPDHKHDKKFSSDAKSSLRDNELKDNKQKSQEIVHEKSADHKRGKQLSSSSFDTKRVHDRDRDRDRDRSRRRSRSRSRSRTRERCRSRNMEENRHAKTREFQRSRRSRSRSASRSRSSHRNNNKTGHRNSSREHESKSSTNEKRNKQKTMESLFGKTPKQNSPIMEIDTEQKAKVMEKMLANAEPFTPIELYTPQSQITAGNKATSDKQATSKQQTEEEVNNYFVSNVKDIKLEDAPNDIEEIDAKKPATKSEDQSTDAAEQIPGLGLINEEYLDGSESKEKLEDAEIKATEPGFDNDGKTSRQENERTPSESIKPANENEEETKETVEHIPGLDLINNSQQSEVKSIDQIEFSEYAKYKATHNEDQTTIAIEKIPGLDLITDDYQDGTESKDNDILEMKTTINKDEATKVNEKILDQNFIIEKKQAVVESFEKLENIPNDIAEIKATKPAAESEGESTRHPLEQTPATDIKVIEQIPGLDLITCVSNHIPENEPTKPVTETEDESTRTIKQIPGLDIIIDELHNVLNDIAEIKETENEDLTTEANEQNRGLEIKTNKYQAGDILIAQLERVSNDTLEIKTTANIENTKKTVKIIPGQNLLTKEDLAESKSIEDLQDASNDFAEIKATKPTTENEDQTLRQTATEEESKVIDNKKMDEQLTGTENKQTKPSCNEIESNDEKVSRNKTKKSPIIEAKLKNVIQVIKETEEIDKVNLQSKEESNNSDKQSISCLKLIESEAENVMRRANDTLVVIEAPSDDNNATPECQVLPPNGVQIIEDIRLPVMMDIEHIALSVDWQSDKDEDDGLESERDKEVYLIAAEKAEENSDEDQLKPMESDKEIEISPENPTADSEDVQAIAINESELESNVEVDTTLLPKPSIVTNIVMYAQPDSTKIDHNEDDPVVEAVESLLIPDDIMAKSLDLGLSFEMDNIELTLEQLHQQSHDDEQPDEATVTSTSMKAPKQDLIAILTQSPVQQPPANVSPYPTKLKTKAKKTGARSASERTTPIKNKECSLTPENAEKTPLKKRKLNLDDETESQVVPQTPPDSVKTTTPSPQHVTIDETLNASDIDNNHSVKSNSSIITKRCSLGQSDYQFERINDEVVLRVTRRGRRRRAAPSAADNNI